MALSQIIYSNIVLLLSCWFLNVLHDIANVILQVNYLVNKTLSFNWFTYRWIFVVLELILAWEYWPIWRTVRAVLRRVSLTSSDNGLLLVQTTDSRNGLLLSAASSWVNRGRDRLARPRQRLLWTQWQQESIEVERVGSKEWQIGKVWEYIFF
jgi:hypothetical protein